MSRGETNNFTSYLPLEYLLILNTPRIPGATNVPYYTPTQILVLHPPSSRTTNLKTYSQAHATILSSLPGSLAEAVKKTHGDTINVAAVGGITNGVDTQSILADGQAVVVFVGRQFQKNPGTVWQFAAELGLDVFQSIQIDCQWPTWGRGETVGARRAEQVL